MKTIVAVFFAVLITAILLPHATEHAAPYSPPTGRYEITNLSPGEFALMIDTATGSVWRYGYADYCITKTSPFTARQIGDGDQCRADEQSIPHLPSFQRVSVEGLYTNSLQTAINAGIDRSFGSEKPKK